MTTASTALTAIPAGLRTPLLEEYQTIIQNFLERRWLPSELSGGRFSEIVYTILLGFGTPPYAIAPSKPADFISACRTLEKITTVPRSFQILIPRMLPVLYEIRNNRSVGHVGGDVDPNHMDAVAVVSICNWIMAELVRVFHGLSVDDAQKVVDTLAEVKMPVIWTDGTVKRVLQPALKLNEQLLLLIATSAPDVSVTQLQEWTEYKTQKYFLMTLRGLHKKRFIELNQTRARILPPGTQFVMQLIRKKNLHNIF